MSSSNVNIALASCAEQAESGGGSGLRFSRIAESFAVPQRQVAAGGSVTFQPVQNQSFQHQLGIGQMPGAIFFKRLKEFGVETIGALHGQRFASRRFGLDVFLSHKDLIVRDGLMGCKYKSSILYH